MKDLTGQRFGRLTVDSFHSKTARWQTMWNCTCDCGVKKVVRGAHLTHGKILSCGCYHADQTARHRMTKTPTYHVYHNMMGRCYRESHFKYPSYGARGIMVCDRWKESFENFCQDMGLKPRGKSIERVNNNGPYSPENCRWATMKEQQRNTRMNRIIEHNGITLCMAEWAEKTGLTYKAIEGRIYRGWDVDKALSTPMLRMAQ